MDHPATEENYKSLRERMVQLLQTGYSIPVDSNIVFVCGGNKRTSARKRFKKYFEKNLDEYLYFEPEFAMDDYFSEFGEQPFDIADFEEMVSDLSCAVVIFPEGPGSFAELGYFSGIKKISQKVILALDANHQTHDSFISMGPAKRVSQESLFQPQAQIDYKNPDFEIISGKLRRFKKRKRLTKFSPDEFDKLSQFELFSLILEIVSLLRCATLKDITSICQSMFGNTTKPNTIKSVTSILVGAKLIIPRGEYGHYAVPDGSESLLQVRSGFKEPLTKLRLEMAECIDAGDPEIRELIVGTGHAV